MTASLPPSSRSACLKRLRRCLALHLLAAAFLLVALLLAEVVIHRFGLPPVSRDVCLIYFGVSSHIVAERALARSKRALVRASGPDLTDRV